jgi:hypothetical protein
VEQPPNVQLGSHAHLSCSPHEPWFEHEFTHVAAADEKREAIRNVFMMSRRDGWTRREETLNNKLNEPKTRGYKL